MKKGILIGGVIFIVIALVSGTICFGQGLAEQGNSQEESAGLSAQEREELDTVETVAEQQADTKLEKVSKTISTVPEKTGNVVLQQFDKVGDLLEDISGDRFETKWDPQREDDPRYVPENQGLSRDPAQGT